MADIAIGLHGGCGTLARNLLSDADWAESRTHLADALRAGWRLLSAGGSALDAVQAAVVEMENSPHFNAGHGAALNEAAEHELDASIMDGASLAAGAVCTVRRIRNPVTAARAVLDSGRAVLLAGAAADDFAASQGLAMVQPGYFTTQRRVDALRVLKARAASGTAVPASEAEKHGTVGAVARDCDGHLAAATSTGGFNNKPSGRVGDSPIIGAGTYAKDGVCAVSCTGQGEIFIRRVAAYDLAARIAYGGQGLVEAATCWSSTRWPATASAPVSWRWAQPAIRWRRSTRLGMYRGWISTDGELTVATHHELHPMGPSLIATRSPTRF